MNIEGFHFFELIEVIEEKDGLVRKLAEGEGTAIHGLLDDTRGKTSHQICRVCGRPRPVVVSGFGSNTR